MHAGSQIRENDFDSAMETVGIDALLYRVMRLCDEEMRPVLRDFKTSVNLAEIDRVRRKKGWTSLRFANTVMALCRLLSPPDVMPFQKSDLDALVRASKCSCWTSVLALRELGAFKDA